MRLTIEFVAGPAGPRGVVVAPGTMIRVGRRAPSEVSVEGDSLMSRQHFAVSFDGTTCRIRDLDSGHGTFLDDAPVVDEVKAPEGSLIRAGATIMRVRLRPDLAPARPLVDDGAVGTPAVTAAAATLPRNQNRVLEHLASRSGRLYALLDAARDPVIGGILVESAEHYQSLYEGEAAGRFARIAPYLVALPGGCELSETLALEGWGESWGIYLAGNAAFAEVRRHLRRFVTVALDDGEKVLFRFYDPRVLRVYLPTCAPQEIDEFFGPVFSFLAEDQGGKRILEFTRTGSRLEQRELDLGAIC